MEQVRYLFETYFTSLDLGLVLKDADHKIESVDGRKQRIFYAEHALFYHLQVEHVID